MPDCDLRGLPRMLLDVADLRDGVLARLPDAEAFRAGILAMAVAWWQVPAASLPAGDADLAYLCGYGRELAAWQRARAGGALAGWVRCTDGRLYHPALAERARDAWEQRQAYRVRGQKANAARCVARQLGWPVRDSKDVRLLRVGKMARLTLRDKVDVAQRVTPPVRW
jgi:hypothetical protein